MLRIRLSRHGAKKDPHYRVVVAEKSRPRDGRYVEVLGHYSPARNPKVLGLKLDRIDYWIAKGAKPSSTVSALVKRAQKQQQEAPEAVAAAAPKTAKKEPAMEETAKPAVEEAGEANEAAESESEV